MGCDKCGGTTSTNNCLENCGCPIEISSFACVRYDGSDMPCLDVVRGETLEAIIKKIEAKFCDQVSGLDGEDGEDGQGIDHTSFTGEPGTEGQPGQTSEYTIWGDAAETIILGTFVVYNAVNGQGVDHTSFTGEPGTEGQPGTTSEYTLWGDPAENINLGTFLVYNGTDGGAGYDSDWIGLNDYSQAKGFGLPAYTVGWDHPKIRVIGKTVFLEGFIMLPLSDDTIQGATLLTEVSLYPSDYRTDNRVYAGAAGGYNTIDNGVIRSFSPILPPDLAPSCAHLLSHFEMSYRPINDLGNKYELNLTSLFPATRLLTDGTLEINTLADTNDDALAGLVIPNSPFHQIVSNVGRGYSAPDYVLFRTDYDGASLLDRRGSPISQSQYPDTFDGTLANNLGGFRVKVTTSYPLGSDITLLQIQQAIAQIQL